MVDRKLNIVFMGTPGFAVPSLQFLIEAGYRVAAVVTAPDKPGGRGKKQLMVSPVKSYATSQGLKIMQPVNLKSVSFINELRSLQADLQVVVAFRMLPEIVWNMPGLGTINLHASLLPAYRGAAPIQWAIIRGERKTGLTTFKLSHEIDTGNTIAQIEMPILPDDNAGTLHDRMMHAGAGLLLGTIDQIDAGDRTTVPQNDAFSSHAPKIHHEDAHIDWKKPVLTIHNLIRGMSPHPGAWTVLDGFELKIFQAKPAQGVYGEQPGQIQVHDKRLIVQTEDGGLEIIELQQAGKRKMQAGEFLNGYRIRNWLLT